MMLCVLSWCGERRISSCLVQRVDTCNFNLARRETGLSPPINIITDRSKAVLLFWIIYVVSVLFLCFRARLLMDALWLSHSIGILGQVWFLIVSIPDRCPLSYFVSYTMYISFLIISPL